MTGEDEKPKRRRRRRRKGKPGPEAKRQPGGRPERRRRRSKAERPAQDQPRSPDPPRAPEHPAGPSPDIRWGDDSDAPTPEVSLAADLPEEPTGDPEPLTAPLEATGPDGREALDRPVADIAGVRFATAGKIYQFDACGRRYQVGDAVAVEGDRGTRLGTIAVAPQRRPVTRSLKKILRRQSEADRRSRERGRERADEAIVTAKRRARELGLEIKIFRGELNPSGTKLVLYFSAEKKTDTRKLLSELNTELGVRVELRQTGVRDEAKMVGGIGSCGRELCCTTWLPAFVPVSIKNAKDQGLVLNPTKVSGQCGRLKCCLVYEQQTYAELRRGLPKLGKRVIADGSDEGRVVEVDVLRRRVRVNHGDGRFEVYTAEQVEPMFPSQKPRPPGEGKKKKKARSRKRSQD